MKIPTKGLCGMKRKARSRRRVCYHRLLGDAVNAGFELGIGGPDQHVIDLYRNYRYGILGWQPSKRRVWSPEVLGIGPEL